MRQEITHTHLQSQAVMGENSYFVALHPQLIKDLKMSLPLDHCLRCSQKIIE